MQPLQVEDCFRRPAAETAFRGNAEIGHGTEHLLCGLKLDTADKMDVSYRCSFFIVRQSIMNPDSVVGLALSSMGPLIASSFDGAVRFM